MKRSMEETGWSKGFTLAELLIVVAIIGVLVAISIPVFTSQLEKARETVDIDNMRSARGVLAAAYLTGEVEAGSLQACYFDGHQITSQMPLEGYGMGTAKEGSVVYEAGNGCPLCSYHTGEDHSGDYLVASVGLDETLHVHWANNNLDIQVALPNLDPNWTAWTVTDSRGLGGTAARANVLNSLGLSDNHEYTFTTAQDGTYVVYIYNGNFPNAARSSNKVGKAALNEWMDYSKSKEINVSVYTYDPKTETTEYNGQQTANAVLRERSDGSWVQIQPVK